MTNNSLYTINPNDSVYNDIIRLFCEQNVVVTLDDNNHQNNNKLIDRRKFGNIIFHDYNKRRMLNHITHPKVIRILIQQMLIWCTVWTWQNCMCLMYHYYINQIISLLNLSFYIQFNYYGCLYKSYYTISMFTLT